MGGIRGGVVSNGEPEWPCGGALGVEEELGRGALEELSGGWCELSEEVVVWEQEVNLEGGFGRVIGGSWVFVAGFGFKEEAAGRGSEFW